MTANVYVIPSFNGDEIDLTYLDPEKPEAAGLVHYGFAIAATDGNVDERRRIDWPQLQGFKQADYQNRQAEAINRLRTSQGYLPGELSLKEGLGSACELNTTIRLGALELLANLSSGRLAAGCKDPFPHQLALQQFMRSHRAGGRRRRILVADEVGLGKTIEAGLIIRDLLVAEGSLDDFSCLYLTSGGLVEDAASKLRDVLKGAIGDQQLVQTVGSFRQYGEGGTRGVHVASTHAARLYISDAKKEKLQKQVAPRILVVDECHHAACSEELRGRGSIRPGKGGSTATYKAILQLVSGEYWFDSTPPDLVILMSATPFRTKTQFVNLLRLLTHKSQPNGEEELDAFDSEMGESEILSTLSSPKSGVDVVWRRQDDPEVYNWQKERLFPNLKVVRPHQINDGSDEKLDSPGERFVELLERITRELRKIAKAHESDFGGFATAQLGKKLTSSSIAGATSLFSRAVRHSSWATKAAFDADRCAGTNELRLLIKKISKRLAKFAGDAQYASVVFASEGFTFPATSLSRAEHVSHIYDFSRALKDGGAPPYVLTSDQVEIFCQLANELLDFGYDNKTASERPVENAKNQWLERMLARHGDDKFLVFTESLQTCEVICKRFGDTCTRRLVGSMGDAEREKAVRDLRTNPAVRILVATSAADEGFDLQVANRVVHWDLSSSPATLMQRNGRVARLGQRSDVTAYYLILPGTHEERRDTLLHEKFKELGVNDENLRNRILGMLDDEQLERLEATSPSDVQIVGDLLRQAKQANKDMEQELNAISRTIKATAVLNRDQFSRRLRNWKKLGLPDSTVDLELSSVEWHKPVFGEKAETVVKQATTAKVTKGIKCASIVFDPEFLVFGTVEGYSLAGLRPWSRKERGNDRVAIRPDAKVDMLGDLVCQLARLPDADFARVSKHSLVEGVPRLAEAAWLLFCTHPIKEAETELQDAERPYLTAYSFDVAGQRIETLQYASAEDVQRILEIMESDLCSRSMAGQADVPTAEVEAFGKCAAEWLGTETYYFRENFLSENRRFVPIPVAVVRIVGSL